MQVGGNCCAKTSCYCVNPKNPGKSFQTTDAKHNGGKCAKKGAAPAAKPAAAKPAGGAFCTWGGKDQSGGYVQVGGNCCAKTSCYCVNPKNPGKSFQTTDAKHNGGKCAVTLQNATNAAIAAIDERNRKAAADKAAKDKAAAAKAAADKAAKKAAESEKLRARAAWN